MTGHKIWTKCLKVMDIIDQKQILKSAPGYRMMNSYLLQPGQMIFWEHHLLLRKKLWQRKNWLQAMNSKTLEKQNLS